MADSKFAKPSSSPPPNCAICLGACSNKCFSDTCMHQFCFKCLLQWSKIKAECPLCKQPFKSILHNVKSNEEYEEHIVETRPIQLLDSELLYIPPTPPSRHRFHFRTTFTVNTRGENAIQEMLLTHSLTNGVSVSNYYPSRWGNTRRRRDTSATSFRRSIYNQHLWASAPPDISGRYRDITPTFYSDNPGARTRLVPWLNRELNALLHENTQNVMQLVDTIMDYLLRYHICSRTFRNLLHNYLGQRTDQFVHEFYNFMRSPFDMIGYDRHVIYTDRPESPTPFIDLSDEDSDVILVGESSNNNPVVIELISSSDDSVIMTWASTPDRAQPVEASTTRKRYSKKKHSSKERGERRRRRSSSSSSLDSDRSKRLEQKKRKLSHSDKNRKRKRKAPKPFKISDFVVNANNDTINLPRRPLKIDDFVINSNNDAINLSKRPLKIDEFVVSSASESDDLPLSEYRRTKLTPVKHTKGIRLGSLHSNEDFSKRLQHVDERSTTPPLPSIKGKRPLSTSTRLNLLKMSHGSKHNMNDFSSSSRDSSEPRLRIASPRSSTQSTTPPLIVDDSPPMLFSPTSSKDSCKFRSNNPHKAAYKPTIIINGKHKKRKSKPHDYSSTESTIIVSREQSPKSCDSNSAMLVKTSKIMHQSSLGDRHIFRHVPKSHSQNLNPKNSVHTRETSPKNSSSLTPPLGSFSLIQPSPVPDVRSNPFSTLKHSKDTAASCYMFNDLPSTSYKPLLNSGHTHPYGGRLFKPESSTDLSETPFRGFATNEYSNKILMPPEPNYMMPNTSGYHSKNFAAPDPPNPSSNTTTNRYMDNSMNLPLAQNHCYPIADYSGNYSLHSGMDSAPQHSQDVKCWDQVLISNRPVQVLESPASPATCTMSFKWSRSGLIQQYGVPSQTPPVHKLEYFSDSSS